MRCFKEPSKCFLLFVITTIVFIGASANAEGQIPRSEHPNIAGFTYTQLTDVEQEVNGIYTYNRKAKFNIKRLKGIFGAPAAIENLKK